MLSHQLLVLVVVCATVGALALSLLLFRIIRSHSLRNSTPLPPIQPLAHRREQQLAQFEASIRAQSSYDPTLLAVPSSHSPSLRGSKVSLLRKDSPSSRHTSYTPTGEGAEELAFLPLEPNSEPLPVPHPLFTNSSPNSSSSVNLNDTPPSSFPSSTPRHSKSLHYSPHHQPLSVTSTASRTTNRRGLPHGPHSQLQIVLPAPLGSGFATNTTRQSLFEHDVPSDRMSIVDRWVPAVREHICGESSNTSTPVPGRTPRRVSNPTGSEYVPHMGGDLPPPVPRVPSIYGTPEAF